MYSYLWYIGTRTSSIIKLKKEKNETDGKKLLKADRNSELVTSAVNVLRDTTCKTHFTWPEDKGYIRVLLLDK